MKIGEKGLDVIKHFEQLYLEAYLCPANVWTIGWGSTKNVHAGMKITEEEAVARLKEDLKDAEGAVNRYVKVNINQNQYDSIVSWTFNLGSGNLNSSTMLKRINGNEWDDVPNQIKRWNKAGGKVLKGLVRRRNAEALLWQSKDWTFFDDYDNAPSYKETEDDVLNYDDIDPPF